MALRLAPLHLQPRRGRLRGDVVRFVDELGQDSFAVSERLRHDHVRGIPKSTRDCAVARYLNAVLSADLRVLTVEVTRDWIVVRSAGRRGVQVRLPVSLMEFIARFDDGHYPELIDSGATPDGGKVEAIDVEALGGMSCGTEVMPSDGSSQPSSPSNPSGPPN
jgi:hypothetical protein